MRNRFYTDELFPRTPVEAGRVIFHVSRLVCDVERFPSDPDEPMATCGMGVIYTRTSMGEVLRAQPSAADRESLLDRRYRPHHLKLEHVVNDVVMQFGGCLIVDRHSFPSTTLPYEPDQAAHRADICIGTDCFHTPLLIRDAIAAATKEEGNSVVVDAPFAGALVPLASYRKDHRMLSVMIEINRHLYKRAFRPKEAGLRASPCRSREAHRGGHRCAARDLPCQPSAGL